MDRSYPDCSPTSGLGDTAGDGAQTSPREPAVRIAATARWKLVLVAACLLVPVVGIFAQSETALENFHRRKLRAWPALDAFASDPVGYFRQAKDWLADRAFPIMAASRLQKRAAYFLLHEAPSPRITLGKAGHIFVNGADDDKVNWFLDAGCLSEHLPARVRELEGDLRKWEQVARRRALQVDVVLVPTSASIYAEQLPDSIPEQYRRACAERSAGRSPLLDVRGRAPVSFTYPLREMLAARNDPAFFPRGNWHPTGLSLQVVRNAYLARLALPAPSDETLALGSAPAEALEMYGIDQEEPTYVLRNSHVRASPERDAQLRRQIEGEFLLPQHVTHVYVNDQPPTQQSVLMLSDSFGDLASEAFTGAFRQLIQINTNELRPGRALELIERVQHIEPLDRLIFVLREGGARRLETLFRTDKSG